jgi:hypothetical protein
MELFLGFYKGLFRRYLEITQLPTLVGMLREFVSKRIPRRLLMSLHKKLFEGYIGLI